MALLLGREEQRLRVFKNRVMRSIFGPKRDKVTGSGENYITKCSPDGQIEKNEMDRGCSTCGGKGEVHTGF
jgi:hypothetical protein